MAKVTLRNISAGSQSARDEIVAEALFNPDQYIRTRTANYADLPIPGLQRPLHQFVNGGVETLEMALLFDRTERRGEVEITTVENDLMRLRTFVTVQRELHAPPVCLVSWGDLSFSGVVSSLKEEAQIFDEAGHLLRAKATITLKAYQSVETQVRSMDLASPDRTRVRVLREGETLAHVALEAYGSESLWPVIARANGIDRPRFVRPGTSLYIPAI